MKKHLFYILVVFFISIRFLHFGTPLDLPHDWRQADTAQYILDFYENGIQLLSPAVCWMGGYENLALEFPLPEAIVSLIQQCLGNSMVVSRSVFLLFFIVAVYYFYRSVLVLFGEKMAQLSSLAYLTLPLSLFYSRAIHIDFFALAATHAMLYYCLVAMQRKSFFLLVVASLCTTIAFLVKVPYVFYLAFPLLLFAWREKHLKWLLNRSLVFTLPLVAFWWWQQHAYAINHGAPDWDYILNYRKFDQNNHWYFGSLQQRLSLYNWKILSFRLFFEVGGGLGFLLAGWGVLRKQVHQNIYFFWAWGIGLLVYLLIFFNLNFFHNYYQLPFLSIMAIGIGFGLLQIAQYGSKWMYIVLATLAISSIGYAEYHYYDQPQELISIGEAIQTHIPKDELAIITYKNFDCRNPRILYRARRKGWSLETTAATPSVLEKLNQEEGANWWAYIDEQAPAKLPDLTIIQQQQIPLNLEEPFSNLSLYIYHWKDNNQ